jgi:serine protease AprX
MTDLPRWDGDYQFPAEYGKEYQRSQEHPDEEAAADVGPPGPGGHVPTSPELVVDSVISKPLRELMSGNPETVCVVIELRVQFPGGVAAASRAVVDLLQQIDQGAETPIAAYGSYVTATLTPSQIERLVALDAHEDRTESIPAETQSDSHGPLTAARAPRGAIYRIWPNFEISALINRSIVTTKCHAAHRSFDATGRGITWAVLDSGIDTHHPHFDKYKNMEGLPHKSFVDANDGMALQDDAGHGTHVAAILAGELQGTDDDPVVAATWYRDSDGTIQARPLQFPLLSGMAPECRLLSCQVLRPDESGDITALLAALQYINDLNAGGRELVVHGVNISVGHPFDPTWFATGLTPVCREVDLLVQSGVVVIVAAGNSGYGYARDPRNRVFRLGFDMTINDPGNAALGLTVGSTSCSPYESGVSYFSSKGPTGDGRLKPDLVAPGERVISAAAGKLAERASGAVPGSQYIENSGTSMAAPHVSGVAAAFLSVHREFIGHPDRVRSALVGTASDIGRSRHFQGAGVVDAMRAIQSV